MSGHREAASDVETGCTELASPARPSSAAIVWSTSVSVYPDVAISRAFQAMDPVTEPRSKLRT
jgi:hypothetical protein